MYNDHCMVVPKEYLRFQNNIAKVQIKNITNCRICYKVRTTNPSGYKVDGSQGIINPNEIQSFQINCLDQVQEAKFQILSVITKSNDDINLVFQRAKESKIERITLKTDSGLMSDTTSVISDRSQYKSIQLQQNLKQEITFNEPQETVAQRIIILEDQLKHNQYTIFHVFFAGLFGLFIGYLYHKYIVKYQ